MPSKLGRYVVPLRMSLRTVEPLVCFSGATLTCLLAPYYRLYNLHLCILSSWPVNNVYCVAHPMYIACSMRAVSEIIFNFWCSQIWNGPAYLVFHRCFKISIFLDRLFDSKFNFYGFTPPMEVSYGGLRFTLALLKLRIGLVADCMWFYEGLK